MHVRMTCDARAEGSGENAQVLMALGGVKTLDDAWRLRDAVSVALCPLHSCLCIRVACAPRTYARARARPVFVNCS
jgi:hypothetical protein